MRILQCIKNFFTDQHAINVAYWIGRDAGYEEGIRQGMEANFERTDPLTKEEYDEVIKFLTDRGLELCCYDPKRGGFSVRKKNMCA